MRGICGVNDENLDDRMWGMMEDLQGNWASVDVIGICKVSDEFCKLSYGRLLGE